VLVVGDALVTGHGTSTVAGPQLLPSVFHHDLERARASLKELRSSGAGVVLPGHGAAWIGPVGAAIELALDAGCAW
jgi:glyoxylase-like metal-dependent hydrolase (beta-lactamase superfamily II)